MGVSDTIKYDVARQKLSDEEKNFILYYLESFNASQSYMKAFPNTIKRTASVRACQLLDKPSIRTELKRLKRLMAKSYDIDPTRYIEFQLKGANADISDYITFNEEEVPVYAPDGTQMTNPDTGEPITKKVNKMHLVDSDKIDTSLIQEIKSGRDGINIKLVDKQKCWDNIKNFFEWHAENNQKDSGNNSLLEALHNRIDDSWSKDEDLDEDLREATKR